MRRSGSAEFARRLALPGGADVELRIRRSQRARRILLHVESVDGAVELVLPPRAPLHEGIAFAREKAGWVARRLNAIPSRVPFADGTKLPVLDTDLRVRVFRQPLRAVERKGDEILVAADDDDAVPGLVTGWLRLQAGREIRHRVSLKSDVLGRRHNRIAIRDPHTLWGSCSPKGNLSFSWRLILAPERVLDYVVAHEVAHLAEMNHGPRFWAIVDALCDAPKDARAWLRRNGRSLHRYG